MSGNNLLAAVYKDLGTIDETMTVNVWKCRYLLAKLWYRELSPSFPKDPPCEADPAGENSSLIFTCCVKTVSLYHLQLV